LTDPAIGLGQIVASDPAFDVSAFLNQAGDTFLSVKSGLESRDLVDVAELVSDDVYDDLRTDVSRLLQRGAIQHYDALGISQSSVAAADHSPTGDSITVLFRAAAIQYMTSEDHDADSSTMPMMPFAEYWTFSRAPVDSSITPHAPECPTCGAPIDIDTGRICRYCKTLLPSPRRQVGWTVVSITPAAQNRT
jgi:predicted lipid-binding transport protein (Tim44 family)